MEKNFLPRIWVNTNNDNGDLGLDFREVAPMLPPENKYGIPRCDTPYLSLKEHEAILAGVNNQLQACTRQIEQFQSKLCQQDEALKIAREAFNEVAKYWFDPATEEGACAICDCNMHENVMGKHGQINGEPCAFEIAKTAQQKIDEILNKKEN